jgi:glycosyltransferase involved in cell wall biosynthesis
LKTKPEDKLIIQLYTPLYYPFVFDLQEALGKRVEKIHAYTTGTFGNYPTWKAIDEFTDVTPYREILGERVPKLRFFFSFFKTRSDMIILSGTESLGSMIIAFLARIKRIPTLLIVEENTDIRKGFPLLPRFVGAIKKRFIKLIHRNSDMLLPETKAAMQYLKQLGCDVSDMTIAPHGLNLAPYKPVRPDTNFLKKLGISNKDRGSNFFILYVGGLYIRKGIVTIIELLEKNLLDKKMKIILTGVKNDLEDENIDNLEKSPPEGFREWSLPKLDPKGRRKLKGMNQAIILPHLSFDEFLMLFTISEVVLAPSIMHRDTERSPNIVIEAMAMGKVVIASDMGGIPTMVGDAGILVPEGDSAALAAELKRVFKNKNIRKDYGKKAKKHAKTVLNSEVYGDTILKEYFKYMNSKS